MVAVFSILATLPTVDTKTPGVGLAAAVLIDATVVRGAPCTPGSGHPSDRGLTCQPPGPGRDWLVVVVRESLICVA